MVYVDNARIPYRPRGRTLYMCHMVADTLAELHAMAEALGVRQYFQSHTKYPHYDICASKRAQALSLGAIKIDRRGLIRVAKILKA